MENLSDKIKAFNTVLKQTYSIPINSDTPFYYIMVKQFNGTVIREIIKDADFSAVEVRDLKVYYYDMFVGEINFEVNPTDSNEYKEMRLYFTPVSLLH